MANVQHAAIAAGFMHALHDPETFAKWQAVRNDPAAIGKLMQETLGLAQAPSAADIEAMREYAETHLRDQHEKIKEQNEDAPHTVGFAFTMQS